MFPDALVVKLIKKALNTLVAKNTDGQRLLLRLKDKKLSLYFTDINKKIIFAFDKEIEVFSSFNGQIDCAIAMAIATVPKLKDKSMLATLIKQNQLELEGDIEVLSQFVSVLESLNYDVAEWLSFYTGDLIAQTLVNGAKSAFSQVNSFAAKQQRIISEVLIEEWKTAPNILEVAHFLDCVTEIEAKASQFELRFNALTKIAESKIKP